MKISLNWLRDFIVLDEPPARVAADLSSLGLPVDGLETIGADTVLDIDVTANRPDCLNHFGIARELAVLYGAPLRRPADENFRPKVQALPPPQIEIQDPALCRRYAGVTISGLRVGPSPAWMQERLLALGQRPINNVVDITNYVLLELGHPLHAFDLDKLRENRIVVRQARPGEVLVTLDGKERTLQPPMLVIADAADAVGLAGVMGGLHSEVDASTTRVLLESAWFLPASIRKTARALGLGTEASYRFERGADPEIPPLALWRTARLILELAGGDGISPVADVCPEPWRPRQVHLRRERVAGLLGARLADGFIVRLLEQLGARIAATTPAGWLVDLPSHRPDLEQEVDLAEELARFYGYDRIPATLPRTEGNPVERQLHREKEQSRAYLREAGFQEILTPSFADRDREAAFDYFPLGGAVRLDNALAEEAPYLRQTLAAGLLAALKWNENNFLEEARLFEIASVYGRGPAGFQEPVRLALGAFGTFQEAHWSSAAVPFGFFHLKGVVEGYLDRLGVATREFVAEAPAFLQPGMSAVLRVDGEVAGFLGQLNELVARELKFKHRVFVAELLLEPLARRAERRFVYRPLPRFPGVCRDISFTVDNGVAFSTIKLALEALQISELKHVEVLDLFRGKDVPAGQQALTLRLAWQHPERTLTDAEADRLREKVAEALGRTFNARIR